MMRILVRSFICLALLVVTQSAGAQVVETPVAFDSAGKIRTLTPALASRLALAAPAWPVSGEFVEARLFESSAGGQVLVVERSDGRLERFSLSPEHSSALRFAVHAAMHTSGVPASDEREEPVSQPARGAFVRNQMLLTWGVYGPLLAAIADDPKGGTALVLLATGASYFAATGLSRKTTITVAQNHLATDGAIRGLGAGMGTLYVLGGEGPDSRSYAAAGLVGALAGQITGFQRGKRLTIAEAEAATAVSTYAAATALGLTGAFGLINETDDGRGSIGAMVGAGLVGYALGPQYPRRARYAVTRGDVQILSAGAILGIGAGLTPFISDNIEEKPFFASATAGMLGGLFLVEQSWVRRYDHSARDAAETSLGMGAGALMGAGIGVLTDANAQAMVGLMTGGGIFGALIAHNLANPQRASVSVGENASRSTTRRLRLNPAEMALAAAGVPGRHSILNVKF